MDDGLESAWGDGMNLPAYMEGEPPFVHFEIKIAARLGLSRDEIRALRQAHLTEGRHWKPVKKRIYLTEEGVELILQKKGLLLAAPTLEIAPRPTPAQGAPRQLLLGPPMVTELVVWNKKAIHNPRLVLAIPPGDDPNDPTMVATILVRTNENFVSGMKLKAVHDHHQFWNLVGPLPRWRGKY